jgi:uncharacterized membrane protein YdjX (TVP38/TMEM64 family)
MNKLRLMLLLFLAAACVYLFVAHRQWLENPNLLKLQVVRQGFWGPVLFLAVYTVGPSFLVPGAVMTVAGGLAFGAWWGAVWSLIGANIGALFAFGTARFLGRAWVDRVMGVRFESIFDRLRRDGFYVTLYLRLVPVIPYNLFNLLAGASPISFSDYFVASIIGMIPGTVLFSLLGDALWHPMKPRFFIAIALIGCCFLGGELYRRRQSSALNQQAYVGEDGNATARFLLRG